MALRLAHSQLLAGLISAVAILLPLTSVRSQTNNKSRPRTVQKAVVAEAESQSLPPNYTGTSFIDIYQAFKKQRGALTKNEFETTPQFRQRVASSTGPRLSFVSLEVEQSFDADRQRLTLQLDCLRDYLLGFEVPKDLIRAFDRPLPDPNPQDDYSSYLDKKLSTGIFDDDYLLVALIRTRRKLGTGIGRTGLGIKLRYTKIAESTAYLVVRHTNLYVVNQKFELPVATQTAKMITGRVAIAITGSLRFPFTWEQYLYDNASLSNPIEYHYSKYFLFLEPDTLVFFDRPTGKILSTLNLPLNEDHDLIVLKPRTQPAVIR